MANCTAQSCIDYLARVSWRKISQKMFRKLEPNCKFDNHHSIFGNSSGLSYSLSHVDLSQTLEYSPASNYPNNCSKQVKRATSYMDISTMGKEKYNGKISGPFIVSDILVKPSVNYCLGH